MKDDNLLSFRDAVCAMVYLAKHEGSKEFINVKEIETAIGRPIYLLLKALGKCARAGLVISLQGHKGGYLLARSADEITILDIFESQEGKRILMPRLPSEASLRNETNNKIDALLRNALSYRKEVYRSITLKQFALNEDGFSEKAWKEISSGELRPSNCCSSAKRPSVLQLNGALVD